MGIIKEITEDFVGSIEQSLFGHSPTKKLAELQGKIDFADMAAEQIVRPIDELLAGMDRSEFKDLKEFGINQSIDIGLPSRITPAVSKRASDVEELTAEELEEQDLRSASKRNLLKINLTGGLDAPTAGVGVPDTAAPTGTGLKVG